MREATLLDDDSVKVQTPDANPIIHYHTFTRRSDGSEYLLVFTKAHIYHWNPSTKAFDTKWTHRNIVASTISFTHNAESADTINDSESGFVTAGFVVGDKITVTGTTNNNGDYTIDSVVAGTITLISTDDLTTEVAGVEFTIVADCKNWETVSYNDKVIATNNVDKVLVWDPTSNFEALDTTSGIEYSRGYSNKTNVDETSAKEQPILKIKSTSGYSVDDKVIIDRGGDREEEGVVDVDGVQDGVSLTLKEDLTYDHTADAKTTVNADSAEGQKVLNVASTAGFSVDEFVTINDGGVREEKRKIYTIQEESLTFTVDLTYTHTQAEGDEVIGSAGTEDSVEEYASYYLTKAKHLTVFENFLILGNTYENESYHYQRARWNSIGEEANWLTGSRGSMEVGQSDKITGFGHYQGFLIIFKESSYFKVWLVGAPFIFNKIRLSKIIGCQCSDSIVNDSKGRLYFYSSEGTFKEISAGTISDDIQTDILAKIQPDYVELIKSAFINETEEVMWSIPVESDSNNLLVSFKEGKWLIIVSAVPAFGEFKE
jgi:hypothetical protein